MQVYIYAMFEYIYTLPKNNNITRENNSSEYKCNFISTFLSRMNYQYFTDLSLPSARFGPEKNAEPLIKNVLRAWRPLLLSLMAHVTTQILYIFV